VESESLPRPQPPLTNQKQEPFHVHRNHHIHIPRHRPAHHELIHNPTHQHARQPDQPERRPETPHHDGRRETLLHVARRQKDPRPRTTHDGGPSVPCRPGTALGQMTPTGPGLRSSRAAGWRRSWTSRSFRLRRTSCPWLSLQATRSRGYDSGLLVGACRRIGRVCIRGRMPVVVGGCGEWFGQVKTAVKTQRGAGPFGVLLPSRWNQIGFAMSGPLATPEHRVAPTGQTGEPHRES
jgi:hypothetical protein